VAGRARTRAPEGNIAVEDAIALNLRCSCLARCGLAPFPPEGFAVLPTFRPPAFRQNSFDFGSAIASPGCVAVVTAVLSDSSHSVSRRAPAMAPGERRTWRRGRRRGRID
jgi:hypothetical protein